MKYSGMKEGNQRMVKMPALFIGHGSPMNIVQDNSYTRDLAALGRDLPRPKAILVVSAHWLTNGTFVTAQAEPKQIYDFGGFPEELYKIKYPAKGYPDLALRVAELAPEVRPSSEWGLDHASWAVLIHLLPKADIPVLELSLDLREAPEYHYAMGRKLAPLRDEGVLVIGSGNIVHNLRILDWDDPQAPVMDWAAAFDAAAMECLVKRNHKGLMNYRHLPESARAVPTADHYLPLLYVLGMQGKDDPVAFTHEGFQNASLSMRCFRVG